MPQFLKYLIVALICLLLGSVLGILIYNHLSPLDLAKKSAQTAEKIQEVAKDPSKAAASADKKTEETKKEAGKEADSKSAGNTEEKKGGSDKKEAPKDDKKGDKKEEGKEDKSESTEYLRSLWPIKKRKTTNVSGEQEGPRYFEGTNPYGPPPSYKSDLLAETESLSIAGDPPGRMPPPITKIPQLPPPLPQPQASSRSGIYQIEMGRFISLSKAQEARDLLRSKGHEAEVYCVGSVIGADWYYVRLSPFFTEHQAYHKSQTIAVLEKIVPAIVKVTKEDKKLP